MMVIKLQSFKNESPDFYKDFSEEQLFFMSLRCKVSGCQYGIEGVDKKPKNHCVWCGKKNPKRQFKGISIVNLLAKKDE